MPKVEIEDRVIFGAWLTAMDWDKRGGVQAAANALGKTTKQISRYKHGTAKLSLETRLAMTALAQVLRPWSMEDEGLPLIHMGFSLG